MAYASRDRLRRECAGIDLDRLATGGELEAIMDDALDVAEKQVENLTARRRGGFNHNTDASISVNGTGLPVLRLSVHQYVPLLDVSAITIDDDAQTLTDFVWDEDGCIEYQWSSSRIAATTMGTLCEFPPGSKNIGLTIDWGYEEVEEPVEVATCLIAKARLLSQIATARDPTEAAIPPGVIQAQVGEHMFRFGPRGQYGEAIAACKTEAKELLAPYVLDVMSAPRTRRGYRGLQTPDASLAHYRADD